MTEKEIPRARDAEPYSFDESLPGSEYSEYSQEDANAKHRTLRQLKEEGRNIDGELFRLVGFPKGKVRRAKLVTTGKMLWILALRLNTRFMWALAACVHVELGDPDEIVESGTE